MQFYIAIEPADYVYGGVKVVEARDMESAAKDEACRMFDEEGCDQMRPVDVYVAKSARGAGCKRFTIRQRVEVTHDIDGEEDIDVAALSEED